VATAAAVAVLVAVEAVLVVVIVVGAVADFMVVVVFEGNTKNQTTTQKEEHMRVKAAQLTVITSLAAMMLVSVGAAWSQAPADTAQGGAEGALAAAAIHVTATVVALDPAKRSVSIVGPLGQTNTYICGPAVRNYDQIKVGDKVKATYVESVAVAASPASAPASVGGGGAIAVAPKGAMPGVVMAKTIEITDKIEAIDTATRTITLEGVMGHPKTVKAGPHVDLAALKTGDDVRLRITQALAIRVEKPEAGGDAD
jgi:hypothetical protein